MQQVLAVEVDFVPPPAQVITEVTARLPSAATYGSKRQVSDSSAPTISRSISDLARDSSQSESHSDGHGGELREEGWRNLSLLEVCDYEREAPRRTI